MNYPPGVIGSESEIIGCECDDDFICQDCAHRYRARLEEAIEPGSEEALSMAGQLESITGSTFVFKEDWDERDRNVARLRGGS